MRRMQVREQAIQSLALALVIVGSAAFYVPALGFLHDDWAFLEPMEHARDRSWLGLWAALGDNSNLAIRPLQIFWYSVFEKLAPGSPAAVHWANQFVHAAGAVLFYLGARRVKAIGRWAFWLVLLYTCLPQYSTARFWYANHQAGLAYLLSALAFLLIALGPRARATTEAIRLAGVFAAALLALLAYELFAFIMLVLPLLVRIGNGSSRAELRRSPGLVAESAVVLIPLILAGLYKVKLGEGVGTGFAGSPVQFLGHALWLYARAAFTDFVTLFAALPAVAVGIAAGPWFRPAALLAAALVVPAALLTRYRAREEPAGGPPPILGLALAGVLLFLLGYAAFLPGSGYGGSGFGTSNRCNIAGAVGVALVALALGRASAGFGRRWPERAMAAFCATGLFVQVTIGILWGEANLVQERTYAQLRRQLGTPQTGSAILLYGVCPFHGPAPVFISYYPLSFRLALDYPGLGLRADTLTDEFSIGPRALSVPTTDGPKSYPYGPMVIVDLPHGTKQAIRNQADAQRFFARHRLARANPCRFRSMAGVSPFGIARLTGL